MPRTVSSDGLVARALLAARERDEKRRAGVERQRPAKERFILGQLQFKAHKILGVTIYNPESNPVDFHGMLLGIREVEGGNLLAVFEHCSTCGEPTPTFDLRDLADLGEYLGLPALCHDCPRCDAARWEE